MKNVLLLLVFLLLAGCSMTVPVRGHLDAGAVACTGTATGYMSGSGDMTISCNDGRTCNGNFVYITSRYGRGTVTCSDGSNGSFDFASTGSEGTGNGYINGKPFTFVFGTSMAK